MAHWIPELSVAALRPLAESSARRVLVERLDSAGVDAVLADAWERYRALEPEIPDQSTVGAGVMVHLSAWIMGIYRALVAAGLDEVEAREWTARVNWPIYQNRGARASRYARPSRAAQTAARFASSRTNRVTTSTDNVSRGAVQAASSGV